MTEAWHNYKLKLLESPKSTWKKSKVDENENYLIKGILPPLKPIFISTQDEYEAVIKTINADKEEYVISQVEWKTSKNKALFKIRRKSSDLADLKLLSRNFADEGSAKWWNSIVEDKSSFEKSISENPIEIIDPYNIIEDEDEYSRFFP